MKFYLSNDDVTNITSQNTPIDCEREYKNENDWMKRLTYNRGEMKFVLYL